VHSVWAGVERLVADLDDTGLTIVRLVDPQLAETMAEAVLAWTLYLHRDMPAYARQQDQGAWLPRAYVRPQRKRVGLLGLGALANAAVDRLRAAGFQVAGWSRGRKDMPGVDCYAGDAELATMLARTDILVCLLPLTPATRGLLDASMLAHLPRHASLINFARGPIIDDEALRQALDSGRLAHAVLDVFAVEPLPPDQWQWRHPNVTVLPHCSAPTDMETASLIVARNIRRYRASGLLPDGIDLRRGY
jgi:glyoxylate/hydroxypyruvate reductase A